MAPPPEYDKEPKAPDKSVTSSNTDDTKLAYSPHDQQTNSDNKPANAAANLETEEKHVEALDDGQLRALLDEAITYKCPKDREGKSSLFKELLEEVEQDEQACEAAARGWGAGAGSGRARGGGGGVRTGGGRARRALPHSNSLQDLVAALAAEPLPRRRHHPPPQVSARTHHGGSLPSGVDTSFLLGEEGGRCSMSRGGGVEYVATVHCENPSPLTERRVSASDAPGADNDNNRRSKMAAFPMTYTARATLEIGSGSGSAGAGRAVTTTTASNQVRTAPLALPDPQSNEDTPDLSPRQKQQKLLSALCPKGAGGGTDRSLPRGPEQSATGRKKNKRKNKAAETESAPPGNVDRRAAPVQTKNLESQKVTLLKRVCSDRQRKLDDSVEPGIALSGSSPDDIQKSTSPTLMPLQCTNPQSKTDVKKINEFKKCSSKELTSKAAHLDIDRDSSESPPIKAVSKETEDISVSLPFNSLFPNYYSTNNTFLKSCVANIAVNTSAAAEIPKVSIKKTQGSVPQLEPQRIGMVVDPSPKIQQCVNKNNSTNPRNKNINSSTTVPHTKPKTQNKKKDVPPAPQQPKPANDNNVGEKFASKPPLDKPKLDTEQNKPGNKFKSKESDVSVSMPFNTLFPNYYNNSYLNSIQSNNHGNEAHTRPNTSNRKTCSEATAPKMNFSPYNYNTVDYNYANTKTEELTKGPPEVLFQKGIAKSRKSPHNNNFLKQYYTNKAYKTNPIICSQNNDESYSYAIEAFGEGSTYSSYDRNRERNNNISEIKKTKAFEKNPGKTKDNDSLTKLENRSPTRNVKPMTIARLVDAPTHDEGGVIDNRIIDNNNGRHCKRKSRISDNAITPNSSVDNEKPQIKDAMTTREQNKLGVKSKDNVPPKKGKPARKDKKKVVDSKEKESSKKVKFDVPKDIIEDLPKTEMKEEEIQATAQISPRENISKPLEMKPVRKSNKIIVVDDNGSIELVDMTHQQSTFEDQTSNVNYFAEQERFFQALESSEPNPNICDSNEQSANCDKVPEPNESSNDLTETHSMPLEQDKDADEIHIETIDTDLGVHSNALSVIEVNQDTAHDSAYREQYILAELSNNAYVFLTVPKRLADNTENTHLNLKIREITSGDAGVSKADKKKRNKAKKGDSSLDVAANNSSDKAILRKLLFEKLLRDGVTEHLLKAEGANKKVDSGIPFSCITTPEVVASCNTTPSTQAAAALDTKPRSSASAGFNGLPLSKPNYGATGTVDEYKKSLDENGNSVQGFSSPLSGSSHNKKPRRKKSSKNETVIKSHQIDGYQGNRDLNELLRFIESNEEQGKKLGRVQPKHKDDADDKGKKRSSERRKDKERATRASSLEERSRTTIAELTGRAKKETAPPARPRAPRAAARRSWGDDARHDYYYDETTGSPSPPAAHPPKPDKKKGKPAKTDATPEPHSDTALELMDFQTVTKKKKQRKRFEDGNGGASNELAYRKPRHASPDRRRKSAPPSDKSNDSNDDMDSVHSLPADAGHLPAAARGTAPASVAAPPAPAPAPHVSYADIARTRHNIPDLIESCNFYAEEGEAGRGGAHEPAAPLAYDADSYPALEARLPRRARDKPRAPAKQPPAEPDEPPPDVVADRRPPVILLDEAARPRDMDGVTFGFDINEQLLNNEATCGATRRCDLLAEALVAAEETAPEASAAERDGAGGVCVRAGLRYVPPAPPPPHRAAALHDIVDYVAHAWEDILKCGTGKVRYFSE